MCVCVSICAYVCAPIYARVCVSLTFIREIANFQHYRCETSMLYWICTTFKYYVTLLKHWLTAKLVLEIDILFGEVFYGSKFKTILERRIQIKCTYLYICQNFCLRIYKIIRNTKTQIAFCETLHNL